MDMAVGRLGDVETCRAGSSSAGLGAGVFMGVGLPPVPGRLVEQIRKWEFLEMYELLPELLTDQIGGEGGARQTSRARGRKRVQEISVWLQCFAVFVGVVAKSSPRRSSWLNGLYGQCDPGRARSMKGQPGWHMMLHLDARRRPRASRTGPRSTRLCTRYALQGKLGGRRGATVV